MLSNGTGLISNLLNTYALIFNVYNGIASFTFSGATGLRSDTPVTYLYAPSLVINNLSFLGRNIVTSLVAILFGAIGELSDDIPPAKSPSKSLTGLKSKQSLKSTTPLELLKLGISSYLAASIAEGVGLPGV